MNVVDSSGWLEYFAGSENADFFAAAIEDTDHLLVPVICVYEVFKRILQQHGQGTAELRVADLYKGQVVDLTASLALSAARLSHELSLPILVTAREHNATLWTQDEDFKDLEGVRYIEKK